MSPLVISKEVKKQLKALIRDTQEDVGICILHIRNELRKQNIDRDKVISYLVKIEEAME